MFVSVCKYEVHRYVYKTMGIDVTLLDYISLSYCINMCIFSIVSLPINFSRLSEKNY